MVFLIFSHRIKAPANQWRH